MAHVKTNIDNSRSPIIVPFAILLVLAMLGGLATLFAIRHSGSATAGGSGDAVPALANVNSTSFVKTGPFAVGETTLKLTSNGAPVEVWYPASADNGHGNLSQTDLSSLLPQAIVNAFPALQGIMQTTAGVRGVPVADGRFPLVVFSHGFAGFNTQSTFLTAHLASWGFIVAAPEHTDRDLPAALSAALTGKSLSQSNDVTDLQDTISLMETQAGTSGSPFYRHIDDARIGAVGHSAGGSAVEKLAVVDSRVKVFIGLAGASYGSFGQTATGAGSKVPDQPGMLMYGDSDGVVPAGTIKNAYNAMKQQKRLVGLNNAGHLVFSDICVVGQNQGGLVGIAKAAGLPIPSSLVTLGTDGCSAAFTSVTSQWPVIDQAVTAELRVAMQFDPNQNGLNNLSSAFGPLLVSQNTTANSVSGATPWTGDSGN